ncbi:MAG: hypothetical protein NTU83_11825 [Candidatus Hydrogenedentes bacterium]|nr:hypothetical protein [Candidatus Hydrogenedentota bacterium]
MHGMLICCAACLAAQALPVDDKALLDAVWTGLESNPDHVRQHRGYIAYLDKHADIASAEEAYCALMQLHAFRAASDAFDEALIAREDTRRAWNAYTEALARNDALRAAEDAWYRAVLNGETVRNDGFAAVSYLQAHPGDALRFLDNPARLVPTPEVLYPLRALFMKYPHVREEWRDTLRALDQNAAAHNAVFAWWNASEPEYCELVEYLARRPSEFWTWRRHELAWAADPHARDWMRYWRGRVRRDAALAGRYDAYMLFLRAHPEWQRAALETWEKTQGAAAAWPPGREPPALGPRALNPRVAAEKQAPLPKRKDLMPKTPKHIDKPGMRVPEMPAKPERPKLKEPPADSRFKRDGLETRQLGVPQ